MICYWIPNWVGHNTAYSHLKPTKMQTISIYKWTYHLFTTWPSRITNSFTFIKYKIVHSDCNLGASYISMPIKKLRPKIKATSYFSSLAETNLWPKMIKDLCHLYVTKGNLYTVCLHKKKTGKNFTFQ